MIKFEQPVVKGWGGKRKRKK